MALDADVVPTVMHRHVLGHGNNTTLSRAVVDIGYPTRPQTVDRGQG